MKNICINPAYPMDNCVHNSFFNNVETNEEIYEKPLDENVNVKDIYKLYFFSYLKNEKEQDIICKLNNKK